MGMAAEAQSVPVKILFKKQIQKWPKTPPPGFFARTMKKVKKVNSALARGLKIMHYGIFINT